jgi:hypothetical protein
MGFLPGFYTYSNNVTRPNQNTFLAISESTKMHLQKRKTSNVPTTIYKIHSHSISKA